ncbi:MAG: DUF434 domain-containing protein [Nannocystaceae bacterium]
MIDDADPQERPRRRRSRLADDDRLFGPASLPALRGATDDLVWLLERGYTIDAALKLVGDRHGLSARQLMGVRRASCTPAQARDRAARRVDLAGLRGADLWIDGFNVLVTLESALAHATVIRGRDGAHRDLAGVHGSYHQVVETGVAVDVLARALQASGPRSITWTLDRPVSSSGRLRAFLLAAGERRGLAWSVELHQNPDPVLARVGRAGARDDSDLNNNTDNTDPIDHTEGEDRQRGAEERDPATPPVIVATSDAWILDHCGLWCDLLGELLRGPADANADSARGPALAMRPDLWLCDLQASHASEAPRAP